jgi:hypothetical protein
VKVQDWKPVGEIANDGVVGEPIVVQAALKNWIVGDTLPEPLADNVTVVGTVVGGAKNRPLLGPAPTGVIFNDFVPVSAVSAETAVVVEAASHALQPPFVVSKPSEYNVVVPPPPGVGAPSAAAIEAMSTSPTAALAGFGTATFAAPAPFDVAVVSRWTGKVVVGGGGGGGGALPAGTNVIVAVAEAVAALVATCFAPVAPVATWAKSDVSTELVGVPAAADVSALSVDPPGGVAVTAAAEPTMVMPSRFVPVVVTDGAPCVVPAAAFVAVATASIGAVGFVPE